MNFEQRVFNTATEVTAKNAEEAGKALQYFEKIFGSGIKGKAMDPPLKLGSRPRDGLICFKNKKAGKYSITGIELELYKDKLTFNFFLEEGSHETEVFINGDTAAELIQKYKQQIKSFITEQEKSLALLKTLDK